jgi:prepilin-type N-terminal cleavage/methylation domain-containing protein
MQKFHSQAGLTLIELVTVLAIVGIVSSLGLVALRGYNRHEDTRRAATTVAGLLTRARSEAIAGGRMTFVLFGEPTDGSLAFDPGQYAAFVIDEDGDGKVGAADAVTKVFLPTGINPDVTSYGAHGLTALKTTALPDADESQQVPVGDLTALNAGTTIPIDPTLGVPVVAFSPQGSPVTIASPSNWGSGAGGVYLTDNDKMVLAVLVQPLGDVRTMAFDTGSGQWK